MVQVGAPNKESRRVFVIMPFKESPTRGEEALTSFFLNSLKKPIEDSDQVVNEYHVHRSEDAFNITEQIIADLYAADIVIADLSGITPNPNVMYELGVRLAISQKPVVLIREEHKDNRKVFDIGHFYIQPYSPYGYPALEGWLVDKLSRIETGEDPYESPVARIFTVCRYHLGGCGHAWDVFSTFVTELTTRLDTPTEGSHSSRVRTFPQEVSLSMVPTASPRRITAKSVGAHV